MDQNFCLAQLQHENNFPSIQLQAASNDNLIETSHVVV